MSKQTIRPGLAAATAAGPIDTATAVPALPGAESVTVPAGSDTQTVVMPRVIEPAAADRSQQDDNTGERKQASVSAADPADGAGAVQHYLAGGSAGVPGLCSAKCACGVTYAGFDTHAEATALLARHIARPERDDAAAAAAVELESVDAYEERRARAAVQSDAAPATQPALSSLLPGCGASATRRIEIYAPSAGAAHGSLAGSLYACTDHLRPMTTAIHDARLTAYVVRGDVMFPAEDATKRCGDGMDFTGVGGVRSWTAPEPAPAAEESEQAAPEPARVPAAKLGVSMLVATGDPDAPGAEVRHVEPSDDGAYALVVFAGARVRTYAAGELVELVDQAVVDAARERAQQRARRALLVEGLRTLVRLAEDPTVPMPTRNMHVTGALDSPDQVEAFAAAIGGRVERRYGRAHAEWTLGDGYAPVIDLGFSAEDESAPADDPIRPAR